ncbi:alpha/beta hydrolase family protein [Pedobacter gandavensis]|uniref:Alpha/beta fold hydrolase n=1 Tax=Pedobacter gandavensis TaxID=2679963 RepID=A0ABR6F2L3_9SPHI|nr:alpha/beta hydrolase [Pedobacter gandavensis]MBB2151773.1 alpha/beta fold hydrolase [Pedobacter gandavensis]
MIKNEQFTITGSSGKPIIGDYTADDKHANSAIIIFVHGFKGFKDWGAHQLVARFFAEKGYPYLKFNLSHSGVSPEKPNDVTDMEAFATNTISMELADLNTVVNFTEQTYHPENIYLIGHSRGGGLTIIQAAKDSRITKLITWASIADFSSLWKAEQEEEWMKTGKIYVENARTKEKMPLNNTLLTDFKANKEAFDIIKAAARITVPWLILHGDEDVNVKFSVAQELAQKQLKAEIHKIEGANHVFGASHPYTETQLPKHLQEVCEKSLAFLRVP